MEQNKPINHDIWLNKIRWKTFSKEFTSMDALTLDCFSFKFEENGLTQDQQELLVMFMGDSDHLNSLNIAEFCNFFLRNAIEFTLHFTYLKKRDWKYNFRCYRAIRKMNKQIKEIKNRRMNYDE